MIANENTAATTFMLVFSGVDSRTYKWIVFTLAEKLDHSFSAWQGGTRWDHEVIFWNREIFLKTKM